MPIYEYTCRECHHRFDALQNMSEDALTTSPSCGKESLAKLVSLPSIQLKGGGWYKDHYGLMGGSGSESSGSSESSSSASSSSDTASKESASTSGESSAPSTASTPASSSSSSSSSSSAASSD